MAPQLGLGTFRIDQTGYGDAYAISNGADREIWALRTGTFVPPSFPGMASHMDIHPILPPPPVVNLAAMCAFLVGIGQNPAHYQIRDHTIKVRTCNGKSSKKS